MTNHTQQTAHRYQRITGNKSYILPSLDSFQQITGNKSYSTNRPGDQETIKQKVPPPPPPSPPLPPQKTRSPENEGPPILCGWALQGFSGHTLRLGSPGILGVCSGGWALQKKFFGNILWLGAPGIRLKTVRGWALHGDTVAFAWHSNKIWGWALPGFAGETGWGWRRVGREKRRV